MGHKERLRGIAEQIAQVSTAFVSDRIVDVRDVPPWKQNHSVSSADFMIIRREGANPIIRRTLSYGRRSRNTEYEVSEHGLFEVPFGAPPDPEITGPDLEPIDSPTPIRVHFSEALSLLGQLRRSVRRELPE